MVKKKDGKPRICDILGVEVGEIFSDYYSGKQYCTTQHGDLLCVSDGGELTYEVLIDLINNPDHVVHKPRFLDMEIEFMRHLRASGVMEIERDENADADLHAFSEEDEYECRRPWTLPPNCIPSLKPGDSVCLSDEFFEDEQKRRQK